MAALPPFPVQRNRHVPCNPSPPPPPPPSMTSPPHHGHCCCCCCCVPAVAADFSRPRLLTSWLMGEGLTREQALKALKNFPNLMGYRLRFGGGGEGVMPFLGGEGKVRMPSPCTT
jgi:hypothetical protein